jgi:uncharacterized repeat protein (TIGR01451 family)
MLVAWAAWCVVAQAGGTAAGTAVASQAEIAYTVGNDARVRRSNVSAFIVAEIIDLDLLLQTPERLVGGGAVNQPHYFTLTNTGNGSEAFSLAVVTGITGDSFDPELPATTIVLDTDASGDLSADDVPYRAGSNDPVLAADSSIGIFVFGNIPTGLADGARGSLRLEATAVTGTGATGSVLAGRGDAGVDALIGPSGGIAAATGEYLVGEVTLLVSKTAVVQSATNDARPMPAAAIQYTIRVAASGTGAALDALLDDAIPAHTTYVPGSLRLDGVALTDAMDADAGDFFQAEPRIAVRLGDLSASEPARVIEFTVTID